MNGSNLLPQIKAAIIGSVKERNTLQAETYRFLLAAIRNEAIARYGAAGETLMTDEDVLEVIRKQVKTRKESIIAFRGGGRDDLAAKEEKELAILSSFLPAELSLQELENIVTDVINSNPGLAFGPLMGRVMARVNGQADGTRVASLLKSKLS